MLTLKKYRNNQKGPSSNLLSTVSKFFLSKSDPDWETEVDGIEGAKTGKGPPPPPFSLTRNFAGFFPLFADEKEEEEESEKSLSPFLSPRS